MVYIIGLDKINKEKNKDVNIMNEASTQGPKLTPANWR